MMDTQTTEKTWDAIVVGAGLAGLKAALELKKAVKDVDWQKGRSSGNKRKDSKIDPNKPKILTLFKIILIIAVFISIKLHN